MRNKKLLFYVICIITIASISHCADRLKRVRAFVAKMHDFFTVPKKLEIPASASGKKRQKYTQKEFITIDLNTRRFDNDAIPQYYILQKNWHLVLGFDIIEAIKVMQKKIEKINDEILRRFLVGESTKKISGSMQKRLTVLKKSDPLYEQKAKEIEEFKQNTEEIVNEFNSSDAYQSATLRIIQDAEKIHIVWDEKTNRLLNMKIAFIDYWRTMFDGIKTHELAKTTDGLGFIDEQIYFFFSISATAFKEGIGDAVKAVQRYISTCQKIDKRIRDIVVADRSASMVPKDDFVFDGSEDGFSLPSDIDVRSSLKQALALQRYKLNQITGNKVTNKIELFSKSVLERPEMLYALQCDEIAKILSGVLYVVIQDQSTVQYLRREKSALHTRIVDFNAQLNDIIVTIFKPYSSENAKRVSDFIASGQLAQLDTVFDQLDADIEGEQDLRIVEDENGDEGGEDTNSHLLVITLSEDAKLERD